MKRLLLLPLLLLSSFAAFAREDGTLSLSPAVVMLRGEFGQSATQTLTLTNGTSRAFTFDLVARDVVVRNGVREFADAGSIAGSIASTCVFSPKRVEVPAGATVNVTMTVTLPRSTSQRAVVAMFRGTNRVMSGNVPMTASLGSLLTFATSDAIEMSAAPLEVQPQTAAANLGAAHVLANAGREPLVARGVMAVLDAKGALIGRADMRPHRLLPGESARIGGEFPGELEPGRYRVMITYDYEGRTLTRSADVEIR